MDDRRRFVLFDFDGVIADSAHLSYRVSRHFNPELDEYSHKALFEGNIYESIRNKLPGWKERDMSKEYFDVYTPLLHEEGELAKDMEGVIKRLGESYRLAIISSTPTEAIRNFLRPSQLDGYFLDILGRDVHTSKVEKIRMVFEKYAVTADDCVYVTDTLGDMREAKQHRMGAIGCSWGVHPRETLEKGVPFRIVDEPKEIPDAVDDYFSRPSDP